MTTIWIVDDYIDSAEIMAEVLEVECGFDTTVFTKGRDLIKALDANTPPDLVILDWRLGIGDFSGYDIVVMMRERGFEIPLIVLSGMGIEFTALAPVYRLDYKGNVCWLEKSLFYEKLVSRVNKMLDLS